MDNKGCAINSHIFGITQKRQIHRYFSGISPKCNTKARALVKLDLNMGIGSKHSWEEKAA